MSSDEKYEDAAEDEQLVELTANNKEDVFGEYGETYVLSACGNKPRCKVTIRSASFNRISAFQKAAGGSNDQKTLRETCELISESVTDSVGEPVWVGREVQKMATGATLRFMELQKAVLQHNGMTPDGKTIQTLAEIEEKK